MRAKAAPARSSAAVRARLTDNGRTLKYVDVESG